MTFDSSWLGKEEVTDHTIGTSDAARLCAMEWIVRDIVRHLDVLACRLPAATITYKDATSSCCAQRHELVVIESYDAKAQVVIAVVK